MYKIFLGFELRVMLLVFVSCIQPHLDFSLLIVGYVSHKYQTSTHNPLVESLTGQQTHLELTSIELRLCK